MSLRSTHLRPRSRIAATSSLVLGAALALVAAQAASAQCALSWIPGLGPVGCDQAVNAATWWDPDGAGPAAPVIVVGGEFTTAGNITANRIAAFDPASNQWSAFGSGVNGSVYSLAVLPDGSLVAAGSFSTAGGVAANRVARWNGGGWSSLGSGTNNTVRALEILPGGELVAAGDFTVAGGTSASRIAQWNGTSWSSLGSGMNSTVSALETLPNGNLVAGGQFDVAGGNAAIRIAQWNGSTWSPLGSGMNAVAGTAVFALAALPNGHLVAGGDFSTAGGLAAGSMARWDGSAWSALGLGMNNVVRSVAVLANGDVVAGGAFFSAGGVPANKVARWDGSAWSAMGQGMAPAVGATEVRALLASANGDLVAGGNFSRAGGEPVRNVARWGVSEWLPLGVGVAGTVGASVSLPNGDLVVTGTFTSINGVLANGVARWDGTSWSSMGSGFEGGYALALAVRPNGDVVAGGEFSIAGGVSASRIASWNGTQWSPLGSGLTGTVHCMTTMPNGDLVVGTGNAVARWNGSSWTYLGNGFALQGYAASANVYAVAVRPNGDVVAGGLFSSVLGGTTVNSIARWDGTTWLSMGGMGPIFIYPPLVDALMALANGDVVAGGTFTTAGGVAANRIARWNGATWSSLGTGMNGDVKRLGMLSTGQLIAGGAFTTSGGVSTNGLARWNGTSWSSLSSGTLSVAPYGLTSLPNGDLLATGTIVFPGGMTSSLARLTTTCPATAMSSGIGCTGSGGPNVLTATTLPWLGATFRARATGMPAYAFVLAATGFSTVNLPLPTLLPQGQLGCDLLISPDAIEVLLPQSGVVTTQLALPTTAALVGQSFHQQVLPLEVDAGLNILALTSSNALTMTIGSF